MNATPAASESAFTRSNPRSWSRELLRRPYRPMHSVSCSCGLVSKSARAALDHAALLRNVGWKTDEDRARCPECVAGVRRRVVEGSKGDRYVLRHIGGAWRCSCPGYSYRGRCSHADSLEAETKERARLSPLARDFLAEATPGATVHADDFHSWLGKDARQVTVEGCRLVLETVLEDYRHVCRECGGEGGEAAHVGGWEEPVVEGYRCSHCNGEGELDPPRLALLEDAMAVAAE